MNFLQCWRRDAIINIKLLFFLFFFAPVCDSWDDERFKCLLFSDNFLRTSFFFYFLLRNLSFSFHNLRLSIDKIRVSFPREKKELYNYRVMSTEFFHERMRKFDKSFFLSRDKFNAFSPYKCIFCERSKEFFIVGETEKHARPCLNSRDILTNNSYFFVLWNTYNFVVSY